MLRGLEEDKPLFSQDEQEGEYTTWTLVWSRDLGAGVDLTYRQVDNYGFCYMVDSLAANVYHRDYAGNEVIIANYTHGAFGLFVYNLWVSDTKKYVLGMTGVNWRQFDVWRKMVLIFSRDTFLDEGDVSYIEDMAISPNGKFILITCESTVTADVRLALLYEGS